MIRKVALLLLLSGAWAGKVIAQGCCSGGGASPMVGGVSMGVLQHGQFDVSASYQYSYSDRFMVGSKDTTSALIKEFHSEYIYTRFGYGISSKLSLYGEMGYFITKKEQGYHPENIDNTRQSSGMADLILLPRYLVWEKNNARSHRELTLGMGIKLPLGKCNDSTIVYEDPSTGTSIKSVSPPTVQTTTGSQDFIMYGFYLHEVKALKLKLFTSVTWLHKGWNIMGERFGDYLGVGVFAGKNYRKWGFTGQLRYEWVDQMRLSPNVDFVAKGISVDANSTGSRKFSFVPQVMYSKKSLTFYALYDWPLYQYMNGTQLAAKNQLTVGFAWRFKPKSFVFEPEKKTN